MRTAVGLHPARHLQDVLQVVDRIYAACCGEAPWDRALAEVARVGRLDGCTLSTIDRRERRRLVLASCGPGTAEDGLVHRISPGSLDRVLRSSPGAVWQERQIGPEPQGRPLGAARMQPSGSVSWAVVIVGRDQRQVACVEAYAGAGRPASAPEPDDLLRQLAPHLTRAWRLGGGLATAGTPAGAARRSGCHGEAAALLELGELSGMSRLRAEFGLTKAEARLALRLAEGASVASAAQDFNVKLTTIRSQLQQVFAKTGTSRQAELVALLLSRGHAPAWVVRGSLPGLGRSAQ